MSLLGPTAIQYNNPLLQQEKLPEPCPHTSSMMNSFSPYHSIIHKSSMYNIPIPMDCKQRTNMKHQMNSISWPHDKCHRKGIHQGSTTQKVKYSTS